MPIIGYSQSGPIAFATSIILYDGIFGTKISPPQACSKACITISTPSCKEMLNLVIFGSVMGRAPPFLFFFKKKGMTEPLDPITLPYLTTENRMGLSPLMLLAATNSLSEVSLVAPYRLIGAQALSVDKATTLWTCV